MTMINNYEANILRSMLALFKAVPGDAMDDNMPQIAMASLEDCVLKGFVFVNQHGRVLPFITMPLFVLAEQAYGIDKEINNQTFWKSFARVRDMDPREYVLTQITHYFSTYGMESLGLKAFPVVPVQDFEIPDSMLPYKRLTVLRLVTGADMIGMINNYALHTTAPSKARIEQFTPLMKYLTISTNEIKSFELQVVKHDMDDTVPADPQTFLRYLVYKVTGNTLLIKNRAMRKSIENTALNYEKALLPYQYLSKITPSQLATIFFRYKPIFLAFKKFDGCAPIINRIRRLADIHHVPMNDVSVKDFSKLILEYRWEDVAKILKKASNRDLVKIINFLSLRSSDAGDAPGVYNIRNGRTFVRKEGVERSINQCYAFKTGLTFAKAELRERLRDKLEGKRFYLPSYINYAVPASEKQFIGNIPWGTQLLTFNPNEAFAVGISWFDQKDTRVDIDLHLNSATQHYGWNGGYTDGQDIIYTGDMTAAPEPLGAAEAYYFKPGDEKFILSANLFSGPNDTEFKVFMSSKKPVTKAWNETYTFDPEEAMFAPIPMKFHDDGRGMNLGMFANGNFYFYGGAISHGIVPSANYEDFIAGLSAKLQISFHMDEFLRVCGAVTINESGLAELSEQEKSKVISLTPEDLTATTLLDIVDGNI